MAVEDFRIFDSSCTESSSYEPLRTARRLGETALRQICSDVTFGYHPEIDSRIVGASDRAISATVMSCGLPVVFSKRVLLEKRIGVAQYRRLAISYRETRLVRRRRVATSSLQESTTSQTTIVNVDIACPLDMTFSSISPSAFIQRHRLSALSQRMKTLFAWDFDWTLVNENSDPWVITKLGADDIFEESIQPISDLTDKHSVYQG